MLIAAFGGQWQADMYLEGSDQHRGWFQSSLLLSLAGNNLAPFKTVLTHGFMVDADREKISKSKQGQGGYEKPQTAEAYVKKYGADVVRLWVGSQDYRSDIVVSEERINKVGEIYRLLRNTLRYQLSNLYDFDPSQHAVRPDQMTRLDRWILDAFYRLESQIDAAYQASEFHSVYQLVSQFAAVELSAIYHDAVKDRLYTDAATSPRRRSTQTALHMLARGLCQMLSPLISFTTDEAWEFLPDREKPESVHLSDWNPRSATAGITSFISEAESNQWRLSFAWRDLANTVLEKHRQSKTIGKGLDAQIILKGSGPSLAQLANDPTWREDLRELLNVSALVVECTSPTGDDTLTFEVAHAPGQKCERCWHWEPTVGTHSAHLTLCTKCASAVE